MYSFQQYLHEVFIVVAQRWRWKLDSSLPSTLGHIGAWVNQAEEILEQPIQIHATPAQTAQGITKKVEDHKVRVCTRTFLKMGIEVYIRP